ncbi:MAG: hypothetical protein MI974_18820 [Chitinophagales bacterium]|nr:hypothetical protein [Chitinophagales bacterium]
MKQEDQILFKPQQAEEKLQRILSKILDPTTKTLFEKVPFKKGMQGFVWGYVSNKKMALLKAFVGLGGNIKSAGFKQAQIEKTKIYDFVYSGLFFGEFGKPITLFTQIYNSLKPGGFAIIEELDYSQFQCFPQNMAFERFVELLCKCKNQQATNVNTGKHTYTLFQQAGFQKCQAQLHKPIFLTGKDKSIAALALESIASQVLQQHLATPTELHRLLSELRAFEKQKNTSITLPGVYQSWGVRI